MVMLFCTILGQAGRPFAVKIARTETVAALKRAIMAEDLNPLEDIEAEQLQLFLAVVPGGRKWLRDGSASVYDLTGGRLNNSIRTMIASPNILPDERTLKDVLSAVESTDTGILRTAFIDSMQPVHVLVKVRQRTLPLEVPESTTSEPKASRSTISPDAAPPAPTESISTGRTITRGSDEDASYCTVPRPVQSRMWQSVLRIRTDMAWGTALVMQRTAKHVYLLTNLHLWIAEYDDEEELFVPIMSDQFQEEVNKYEELNPKKSEVRPPSKFDKRKSDGGGEPPTRKSLRLAEKETKLSVDLPWVFLDQHVPGNDGLEEICRFQFHCGVCLSSSGTRDFALLMIPVTSTANKLTALVTADSSTLILDTVKVHVFGFPGALASDFNHFYTITPAEITGSAKGLMTLSSLSCSGLSGSVIVCTETDRAIGYLCGGLNTPENEQFQAFGFCFDETVLDNLLLEETKPSAETHTK